MFTVEVREGRLIEARVQALKTLADANEYAAKLAGAVAAAGPDRRMILCADHRPVGIYSQAVADALASLFRNMNARLERVAIVVARSNATLAMQLERIVREAAYSSRRVFYATDEVESFLSEVLDERERHRLALFMAADSSRQRR